MCSAPSQPAYEEDDEDSDELSDAMSRTIKLVAMHQKVKNMLKPKEEYDESYIITPSMAQGVEFSITQ